MLDPMLDPSLDIESILKDMLDLSEINWNELMKHVTE
jgi:hypothetical protein